MTKNNPARQGKVYDRLYELKKGNAKNFSNLKEDILNQIDAKTIDSEPNYSMIADLGGEQLKHTPISNQIIVNWKGQNLDRHVPKNKN